MEMEKDEDAIQMALARASELKNKFSICIRKVLPVNEDEGRDYELTDTDDSSSNGAAAIGVDEEEEEEEEEVVQRLLKIRDALGSLENQLAFLQELQHQQRHQREFALLEIELSRKKLLKKLKKYKGKDFQVICETAGFASEPVEVSKELLPPHYPYFHQNEIILSTVQSEAKNQSDYEAKKSFKGFRSFINATAKTMLMFVGLVSVLQLTGFKPRLGRRRDAEFKKFGIFRNEERGRERKILHECPPGKVLLTENGETRCIVKERVEVPFESVVVPKPDASLGCG